MHKPCKRLTSLLLVLLAVALLCPALPACADYSNPDTGYRAEIHDEVNLFSSDSETLTEIGEAMKAITAYGDVAVITCTNDSDSTRELAEQCREDLFGKESSTVFVIDMTNRNIYIYSYGKMRSYISPSNANLITDNTYQLATAGDYAGCVLKSLQQMQILLEGGRISQRMKWICNALISVLLASVMVFIHAKRNSMHNVAEAKELLQGTSHENAIQGLSQVHLKTRKTSHSGSGFGHGGGGGSGGGGGGHGF